MWRNRLPSEIESYAVQFPGRGARSGECAYRNLLRLAQEIVEELGRYFDVPFALFGHSMGAHIAFEIARILRQRRLPQPLHLFVSAAAAPHWPRLEPIMFDSTDTELIAHLKSMKGTPPEIFENDEMLQVLLPVIRADFEMIDTYTFAQGSPLDIPISAYGGRDDQVVPEKSLLAWAEHTTKIFAGSLFDGGHFFIRSAPERVLLTLSDQLISTAALDSIREGECESKLPTFLVYPS